MATAVGRWNSGMSSAPRVSCFTCNGVCRRTWHWRKRTPKAKLLRLGFHDT